MNQEELELLLKISIEHNYSIVVQKNW
jgi:hypothetical protein